MKTKKEAERLKDEMEYLKWFKIYADFGPADTDVHMKMDDLYEKQTGKKVPVRWKTIK